MAASCVSFYLSSSVRPTFIVWVYGQRHIGLLNYNKLLNYRREAGGNQCDLREWSLITGKGGGGGYTMGGRGN